MNKSTKTLCDFPDCGRDSWSRGLCGSHYAQRRQGQELRPIRQRVSLDERIWSKVKKTDSCWEWTGSISANGYGHIRVDGKTLVAHRLTYERAVGPIPVGLFIDHICRNRGCVRPSHLRPATHKQNMENRGGAMSNSTTGLLGVSRNKSCGRYVANVRHNGHLYYLGLFDTAEEANAAAVAKRLELFTYNDNDRPRTA